MPFKPSGPTRHRHPSSHRPNTGHAFRPAQTSSGTGMGTSRPPQTATHDPAVPGVLAEQASPPDQMVRLSKRMTELGLASRREADAWIEKGWVRVDGQVLSTLGVRIRPEQTITIDRQAREQQAQQVTVLLHKPIGYVSGQAEDGHEPAFVLVQPQNRWEQDDSGLAFHKNHLRHLVPAGRLDIDSTGLLVLTQDGRVARHLIGENSRTEKEYLVRVQSLSGQPMAQTPLNLLRHGLSLDGQALRPARVEWLNEDQLRFVLQEGKKRQIRRMCEAVGLRVVGLKRVRIGQVMLGNLPPGQWRYLKPDEKF
jgi:23S rRNA pseudouridine2604 synthase